MTIHEEIESVEINIPRDHMKRPLILQADGTQKAYTRASTFTEVLDNKYTLEKWKRRQTLVGVTLRPDLVLAVSRANNLKDEKARNEALDELVEECMVQAGANSQADIGTALHGIFENIDEGDELVGVPIAFLPGIAAYKRITAWLRMVSTESFGVCEQDVTYYDRHGKEHTVAVTIAGSWDRIIEFIMPEDADAPQNPDGSPAEWPFPFPPSEVEDMRFILDNKTSQEKSLSYGWTKWAAQTSIYSRCKKYYPDGTREDLGTEARPISQKRGLILHQPSGSDVATLYFIDLVGGWDAVALAAQVRGLGAVRSKLKKMILSMKPPSKDEQLMAEIAQATSRDELVEIHGRADTAWKPKHTEATKSRLKELGEEIKA